MLRARVQVPARDNRVRDQPAGTISGRSPTRAVRFTLSCHSGRRHHRVRRSGRGDRPSPGHAGLSASTRRARRQVLLRRDVCFTVSCALRTGAITTFDVPGAGTGPGQGTFAGNINPAEAIAGRYVDASDVAHGFLRAPDAQSLRLMLETRHRSGQGTFVFTGFCSTRRGDRRASVDASDVYHGFLRAPTARSPRSILRAWAQGPGQGTIPLPTIRLMRSPDTILTRTM